MSTPSAKFARANRNTYRLLRGASGRKMNALRERRYRYWVRVEHKAVERAGPRSGADHS